MSGKISGKPRRKPDSSATAGAMPRVCARRSALVTLIGYCVASAWLCACSNAQGNQAPPAGTGGVSGSSGGGGGKFAPGGTASDGGVAGGDHYSACEADQPCAVLPLGDSITEGFGSSGGGYRVELFRRARQNGKNIGFVGSLQNGPERVGTDPFPKSHEGHGGYTIDSGDGHSGISGLITDQALSRYHPQIVLLMIGTNDVDSDIDLSGAPIRLGNLIDDITTQAPDALLVVATIVPIDEADSNQKAVAYNAALPELVSARAKAGKHVVLLDNYAIFAAQPNFATTLLSDSLHPNDAGYAVLGKAFYDRIAPSLP
jgi:lysophospholipase L1-like esterase